MAGRNSKISPEKIKEITDLISVGNYANVACQCANISDSTYYVWLERGRKEKERMELLEESGAEVLRTDEYIYVEFMDAVKKAEGDAEMAAVVHVRNAMADSWQAAMTYLERKHPERWGRRDRNVNVNIDATESMDLSELSDEELAQLESLMLKANPGETSVRH